VLAVATNDRADARARDRVERDAVGCVLRKTASRRLQLQVVVVAGLDASGVSEARWTFAAAISGGVHGV
jgi:hypothetical protein